MAKSEIRWVAAVLLMTLVFGILALSPRDVRAEGTTPASGSNDPDALLKLANQAGFKNLTDCERKLLQSGPAGEGADCRSNDDKENDPSKGDQWPESRQVHAKLIRWLCVNEAAGKLIGPRGIQIYGAVIREPLGLDFISVSFPLMVANSRISAPMSLLNANIDALDLGGTSTGSISADFLATRRGIFLRNGFHAEGEVRLYGATIGGDLDCAGGTFNNRNGYALYAEGINVAGDVSLGYGFKATGEVSLLGASVGRNLECMGGTFSNPNRKALTADGIKAAGGVYLRDGFHSTGEVRLPRATVGGDLDCSNATFSNPNGDALHADGLKARQATFFFED
jgi:hypothetical protein